MKLRVAKKLLTGERKYFWEGWSPVGRYRYVPAGTYYKACVIYQRWERRFEQRMNRRRFKYL